MLLGGAQAKTIPIDQASADDLLKSIKKGIE
jgi:hypothetical protein